jgi:hypothetical protein
MAKRRQSARYLKCSASLRIPVPNAPPFPVNRSERMPPVPDEGGRHRQLRTSKAYRIKLRLRKDEKGEKGEKGESRK